jgi:hypothetical protein
LIDQLDGEGIRIGPDHILSSISRGSYKGPNLMHEKNILLDGLPFDSKGAVRVNLLSNSWRGNDETCRGLLESSILPDEVTIPAAVVARATKDTTLTRIAIDLTGNQYKGEQNKGVNFNSQGPAQDKLPRDWRGVEVRGGPKTEAWYFIASMTVATSCNPPRVFLISITNLYFWADSRGALIQCASCSQVSRGTK